MSCAANREMGREPFVHDGRPDTGASLAPERRGTPRGVPCEDLPPSFPTKPEENLDACRGAIHPCGSSAPCKPLSSSATACRDSGDGAPYEQVQHSAPLDQPRPDKTAPSSTDPAQEGNGSSAPGLYSCFACRNAKRLCDKRHPCGRCVRLELTCVLQSRGRGRPSCKSKPRFTCRPRAPAPRAAPTPAPPKPSPLPLPFPLEQHDPHFHAPRLPEPWTSMHPSQPLEPHSLQPQSLQPQPLHHQHQHQQGDVYGSERRVRPRLHQDDDQGGWGMGSRALLLDGAAGQALLHRACQALLHLGTRSSQARPLHIHDPIASSSSSSISWRLPLPPPPAARPYDPRPYSALPAPFPFPFHHPYKPSPPKQVEPGLYHSPHTLTHTHTLQVQVEARERDLLLASLPRLGPVSSGEGGEWGASTMRALASLPPFAWAAAHSHTHTHMPPHSHSHPNSSSSNSVQHFMAQLPHGLRP